MYPETLGGEFAIVSVAYQLYVVSSDNLHTPQIIYSTRDHGSFGSPVWSPGGGRIAIGTDVEIIVVNTDIEGAIEYVVEPDIAEEVRDGEAMVTCANIRGPIWTPDGQSLVWGCQVRPVFSLGERGIPSPLLRTWRFYSWSTRTQQTQSIVMPENVSSIWHEAITWDPSSERNSLVINVSLWDPVSQEGLGDQTWLLDVATGEHKVLIDCEQLVGRDFCRSVLSPQGTYFAVRSYDDAVYILHRQTGQVTSYTLPERTYTRGKWSPDEQRLVFGGNDLLLLHVDSGSTELLMEGYSRRPLLGQIEWVEFESSRWLDNEHVAVVRDKSRGIPGNWEHYASEVKLQIVRIEDAAVWTVFQYEHEYENSLRSDWTPAPD